MAVLGFRSADRFRLELAQLRKRNEVELLNLLELIRHLADSEQVFLESHEASRALLFSFDLENGQDASAAAAAGVLDPRVASCKEKLLSEHRIAEQDFFFNYFSHVAALLSRVFSDADDDVTLLELQSAVRAMIRVEDCAPLMAYLSWERFTWARDSIQAANAGSRGTATPPAKAAEANADGSIVASALSLLEPIFSRFQYSRADVVSLACSVANEEMGGPKVAWSAARRDDEEND